MTHLCAMCKMCAMCKTVQPNVAYSIDYGGPICDPCDRELYEAYARATRKPVLTWGGLR